MNKYIDLTLLKAEATTQDIKELCEQAKKYKVAAVCVNSSFVSYVKEQLSGSDILVCTVVGFPLGANTTFAKVLEAQLSVDNGADEIDMVAHIGKIKEHDFDYIEQEIELMKMMLNGKVLKVIVETALLSKDEIVQMTLLLDELGVDFIKTSTGFSKSGASVAEIELMKKNIQHKLKIKASGGIKTNTDLKNMIAAGASRVGTSSTSVLDA